LDEEFLEGVEEVTLVYPVTEHFVPWSRDLGEEFVGEGADVGVSVGGEGVDFVY